MQKRILILVSLLSLGAQMECAQRTSRQNQSCWQLFKKACVASGLALLTLNNSANAEPNSYTIKCYQVCASDLYGREVGLKVPLCKNEDVDAVRTRMQNVLGSVLKDVEVCPSACTVSQSELALSTYCLKSVAAIKDEHIERWRDASPVLYKRNN
jgi:hypothetical protein